MTPWFSSLLVHSRCVSGIVKRELVSDTRVKIHYNKVCYTFGKWYRAIGKEGLIDRESLKSVPDKQGLYEIGVDLPGSPSLLVGYAGKSTSLYRRLVYQHAHLRDKKDAWMKPYIGLGFHVYFRWLICPAKALDELETKLINQYNYAHNKSKVRFPRCKSKQTDLIWEKKGALL